MRSEGTLEENNYKLKWLYLKIRETHNVYDLITE